MTAPRTGLRGAPAGVLLSGRGASRRVRRAQPETFRMRFSSSGRTRASRVLGTLALTVAAACGPDLPPGGYATVTHRGDPPAPPVATHPDPAPLAPGTMTSGASQKVTLANAPAGVTQQMVDLGQEQYGTVCSACHGTGGVGSAAAPPLNDREWIHIGGQYPEIVAIINSGVAQPRQYPGAMPPRGGGQFTPEQVNQIAAYVYALSQQGES